MSFRKKNALQFLYFSIFALFILEEKIAIQGIKGSFHHTVVNSCFKNTSFSLLECYSFDELIQRVLIGEATKGVLAIENSIAGSIMPNYQLIDNDNLEITGEYFCEINHNLITFPGQSISEIKEVHSHPMALQQCKVFFEKYPHIKLIEANDTARVVKVLAKEKQKNVGAIAGKEAAAIYNMEILFENIQTIKNNITRFLIIQKKGQPAPSQSYNKASLKFLVDHKRGSLAAVLNVISDCKINMTKIQSVPVIATPGKYAFFLDIVFDSLSDFEKCKSILRIMTEEFRILGTYPKG